MNHSVLKESFREKLRSHPGRRIEESTRIPAAVLIPLIERDGEIHLLFTKRTNSVQHHRGEICFPGGARDSNDEDLLTTALRELQEEIAVPADQVEILGCLDELPTVTSNFIVIPFVGLLQPTVTFQKSELEVEEILEIPLNHFREPEFFSTDKRIVDRTEHTVYYYQWRNHTIWGVTGRILKSFLDLIYEGEADD